MYCLILLYYVMRIELRPLNPISKFSAIKLVVFMTFWQSVLLAMLVFFKILEPKETWAWQTPKELANGLQDRIFNGRALSSKTRGTIKSRTISKFQSFFFTLQKSMKIGIFDNY